MAETLTLQQVYDWLDAIAPFASAEDFDNPGLLLGSRLAQVRKVLFCVDATEAVAVEAVAQGAELVVSHHPLMFGGIHSIDYDLPEGRVLRALIHGGQSLIACHTNWDKAPGGIADSLALALGLQGCQPVDDFARLGTLSSPMTGEALAKHVSQGLHAQVRCYGQAKEPITRVAVGPGAYGEGALAVQGAGAQAYVVGEIKHHEILDACAQGLLVLDAGHYATEAPGMAALYKRFQTEAAAAHWPVQALLFSQAPFAGA